MALLKTFALDTDPGYGFEWLRAALELTLQEGVIGPNDYKVSVAAAGGNRVDVAAGLALVKGDSGVAALGLTQGLYLQGNDATIASALTFAPGDSQPRLDQVVLYVNDSSDLASPSNVPSLGIVKGTAIAGTTLDTGYTNGSAAALPPNALRLADRLVPAGVNTIAATDLRDRRKWARGANASAFTPGTGGSIAFGPTTPTILHANLAFRLEASGLPLLIEFAPTLLQDAGNVNATLNLSPYMDGAAIFADTNSGQWLVGAQASNNFVNGAMRTRYTPAAGSHLFDLRALVAGQAWNIGPRSMFAITEEPRVSATNT